MMDKREDMRRGASQFSLQINKQSGQRLLSGFDGVAGIQNIVSLEKSKKEKVRKRSAVNGGGSPIKEECEMGCSDFSCRENECPSQSHSTVKNGATASKSFKIPKRFFDDCNLVDHASVPRKLRSAMKKRNCESVSPTLPDSNRLNNIPAGEKDVVNKHKLNLKNGDSEWSRKLSVSGPITKDEEEVVETLYALAGMFPDNHTVDNNKLDGELLEGKPSAPQEMVGSAATAIEVKKDESSVCLPEAVKALPSVNLEISPNEAVKINSFNGSSTEEQLDLPDNKMFHMEPNGSVPQVNSLDASLSLLAKAESSDKKPPSILGNFNGWLEPSLETGLKPPKQQLSPPTERKLEIAFGATSTEVELAQEHVIKEAREKVPLGGGNHVPSQSSVAKIPAWLDAAICPSRPSSSQSTTLARKVSEVTKCRKPIKRCIAHVNISHLIQSLKMPESKDVVPLEHIELNHQGGLKQAVVMPRNDFNGGRNGINGTLSIILTSYRNPNEAGSGSQPQHNRLHQDGPQDAQASGMHTSHKQTYDFLSLSAGGSGDEIKNSSNKGRNAFETLSHHQVPYLHSLPQHQSLLCSSLLQARSTSTHSNQLPVATASSQQQGQLQLPPYLTSPYYGPSYTCHQGLAKRQPQQLQQPLLAAQFPRWKNGKHESAALIPGVHAIIPPSPSSIVALGPRYSTVPQHQQPLMPISSPLALSNVKRQEHHLPIVYEESGAGFRGGGALTMQLLCNERL